MLQPAALCYNKVQIELKEEHKFYRDKESLCHDTAEEECGEDCRDTLDSIATLI